VYLRSPTPKESSRGTPSQANRLVPC
jgi:hypothetical protein